MKMKLVFQRAELAAALQTVAAVVPSKTTKDILKNVKLQVSAGVASLTGTDGEMGLRRELSVTADGEGAALLPTARMLMILREMSADDFRLETGDGALWIRCGSSEFRLSTEEVGDFPPVAKFEDSDYFTMKAGALRQLIRRTSFATDMESTRYALGGAQFDIQAGTVTMAATDSRRLAVAHDACGAVGSPLLPGGAPVFPNKLLTVLERCLSDAGDEDVRLAIHKNDVAIQIGPMTATSQLLQGRFPDWRKVVPQQFTVTVDMVAAPLHSALRQAMVVTNEESRGVDFSFAKGRLRLGSKASEIGQSTIEVPIAYEAAEIKVTLDPRYIIDFLKAVDGGSLIVVKLISCEDPVVLTCGESYSYVAMPLSRDR